MVYVSTEEKNEKKMWTRTLLSGRQKHQEAKLLSDHSEWFTLSTERNKRIWENEESKNYLFTYNEKTFITCFAQQTLTLQLLMICSPWSLYLWYNS